MKFTKTLVITGFAFAATALYAAERTDPNAIARSELMETIGGATKVLGGMAGGKAPYDAAAAEAAKTALAEAAAKITATFETQGGADPADEAKPEIWANWDDFVKKSGALEAAATALDASSLEGVQAGMGAIGGTCKDCHTAYRM
ncbi:cytochrome C556 [Gemmobacter aquarius]|uniref:Cytochrome C556 n=1 Tax=Paragemmobacter aquarius TaxID=2169400 RepID=A0A2S0UHL4_9RHOB|nr:cytochrome c [Gemmobacter aquarius]AWB47285.1 cytochrome C556 [Gemmobacter aquarius]